MMNRLILALLCCCLAASLATSSPYRGKPLSLDVRDADVRDLLRFLADFGEADLVLDESVNGRITIKLQNVPWDQAMELILKQLGYGIEIIGKQSKLRTFNRRIAEDWSGRVRLEGRSLRRRRAAGAKRRLLKGDGITVVPRKANSKARTKRAGSPG